MKKLLACSLVLVLLVASASVAFADKLGLGISTSIGSSKDAYTEDGEKYDGNAQVDSTIVSVVIGDDGLIKNISIDSAQTKIGFDVEGKLTADKAAVIKSKMEKQEEYGMRKASPIGKEWFEQIAAFEAYCIGKTVEEIVNMPTYAANESHTCVSDVADLKTTCTIDVGAILKALEKAAANAK